MVGPRRARLPESVGRATLAGCAKSPSRRGQAPSDLTRRGGREGARAPWMDGAMALGACTFPIRGWMDVPPRALAGQPRPQQLHTLGGPVRVRSSHEDSVAIRVSASGTDSPEPAHVRTALRHVRGRRGVLHCAESSSPSAVTVVRAASEPATCAECVPLVGSETRRGSKIFFKKKQKSFCSIDFQFRIIDSLKANHHHDLSLSL